jgi:hypothetical protein
MKKLTPEQIAQLKNPIEHSSHYIDASMFDFLKCVGSGRHRMVFILPGGRHVIKVPCSSAGIKANRQEVQFSKTYPSLVARARMFGQSSVQLRLDDARFLDARNGYEPMDSWTDEEQALYSCIEDLFANEGKSWMDHSILQYGYRKGRPVVYDCNDL